MNQTDILMQKVKKISLGQIDSLIDSLQSNDHYKSKYNTDYQYMYEKFENITDGQRRYMWTCIYNKKYLKLDEILKTLKIIKL